MKTVRVLNFDFVDSDTPSVIADFVAHVTRSNGLKTVVTPNPEQLVLAWHQPRFTADLRQADLRLPDGSGLIWASRRAAKKNHSQATLMSNKLTNRITGADVVAGLIDQTQLKGKKVALIGGFGYQNISPTEFPGVSRLNLEHNQTQLYWCSAYQDISQPSETEEKAVQNFISSYKPDIVFVALGAPWQERWLISHREFLERAGVKLAMVVGGAFDFLTGRVRRAPPRWQKWHLEWLWRLWQQPWRARRQLALVEFVWRVWWKQYN